jgi:hypothetical protein
VQKKTRSILETLNSVAQHKNNEALIESRASHIIDSAINLIGLIKETYNEEISYELERRLLNSIKAGDSSKFVRGIRKVRDLKETKKKLTLIPGDIEG